MICSGMAVLGGILLASRLRSVDTGTGGGQVLLYPIAAAVIGGTSLFGGRGTMKAALLGALVMIGIDNGLGLLGLSSGTKFVVTGGVLLLAVSVDSISRRGRASIRTSMTLRLGLLSTAAINRSLLGGARVAEGVEVVAVASRDRERAEAYAAEHGLGRAHGSYEALLEDPEVDAVYVPLPNSMHVPWSIRALEAGKHVLCEKPLTRRPEEAEAAFDAADRAGLVLAEAFMWRHHAQARKLRELVAAEAVGPLRMIRSAFSFDIFAGDRAGDVRLEAGLDGGGADGRRLLLRERDAAARRGAGGGRRAPGARRGRRRRAPLGDAALRRRRARRARLRASTWSRRPSSRWSARRARCSSATRGTRARRGSRSAGRAARRSSRSRRAIPYAAELIDFAAAVRGERPHPFGRADAVGQARAIAALYDAAA